jgi:hypothetical protein
MEIASAAFWASNRIVRGRNAPSGKYVEITLHDLIFEIPMAWCRDISMGAYWFRLWKYARGGMPRTVRWPRKKSDQNIKANEEFALAA